MKLYSIADVYTCKFQHFIKNIIFANQSIPFFLNKLPRNSTTYPTQNFHPNPFPTATDTACTALKKKKKKSASSLSASVFTYRPHVWRIQVSTHALSLRSSFYIHIYVRVRAHAYTTRWRPLYISERSNLRIIHIYIKYAKCDSFADSLRVRSAIYKYTLSRLHCLDPRRSWRYRVQVGKT